MDTNTLLNVLEQLLHKIQANRGSEMAAIVACDDAVPGAEEDSCYACAKIQMQIRVQHGLIMCKTCNCASGIWCN